MAQPVVNTAALGDAAAGAVAAMASAESFIRNAGEAIKAAIAADDRLDDIATAAANEIIDAKVAEIAAATASLSAALVPAVSPDPAV